MALSKEEELEILDTFHDFCTKERKRAGGDDDEGADDNNLQIAREYVNQLLANNYPAVATAVNAKFVAYYLMPKGDAKEKALAEIQNTVLSTVTKAGVTVISKLENKTVEHFEKKYANDFRSYPGMQKTITYETILNGYKNGKEESPLWKEYRMNRATNSTLKIQCGKNSFGELKLSDRNIIANFLLNYFFGTSVGNFRITFDAKTGIVGKVFTDIEQVINLIFPQTIADSATTSFSGLKGRNEFYFPSKTDVIPIESSLYSRGEYELSFEKSKKGGFSQQTPYGFSIEVKKKDTPGAVLSLPFSATQTEGPSVNYLIDILKEAKKPARNFSGISKKNQILSVGKYLDEGKSASFKTFLVTNIQANKDGLLLDLKRAGDHETVNATVKTRTLKYPFIMMATIDELCALKSREKKNNTMYHHDEEIDCFRFEEGFDPRLLQRIKAEEFKYRIKELSSRKSYILGLNTTINQQIENLYRDAEKSLNSFARVSRPNNPALEQLITYLFRLKMIDIQYFLDVIFSKLSARRVLEAADIAVLEDGETKLGEIQENIKAGASAEDINSRLSAIEISYDTIERKIKDFLNLGTSPTVTLVPEEIRGKGKRRREGEGESVQKVIDKVVLYKQFSGDIGAAVPSYFYEMQNTAIKYNAESFYKLYELFVLLNDAVNSEKNRGSGGNYPNPATRQYSNFMRDTFKKVESCAQEILGQFISPQNVFGEAPAVVTLKDMLSRFSLFQNIPMTGDELPHQLFFQLTNKFFSDENPFKNIRLSAPTEPPITFGLPNAIALPGAAAQSGGADGDNQYYDSADLLYEISTKAAAFIESVYSESYPEIAFLVAASEVQNIAHYMRLHYKNWNESNGSDSDAEKYLCMRRFLLSFVENAYNKYTNVLEIHGKLELYDPYIKGTLEFINYITNDRNPEIIDGIEFINCKFQETIKALGICYLEFPAIDDFCHVIYTKANYLATANEILEEIQQIWETGFRLIVNSTDYTFVDIGDERGLTTNELITRLLTKSHGESLDSILWDGYIYNTRAIKKKNTDFNTSILPYLQYEDNQSIKILLLFTLLENIQNPNKFSFFLEPRYQNRYFNSRDDWNLLLYQRIKTLLLEMNQVKKIHRKIPSERLRGGGHRKYPKKTRRQHKKKKRMTRRKH